MIKKLASEYATFFENTEYNFFKEPKGSKSNYWLNCIIFKNKFQRNKF